MLGLWEVSGGAGLGGALPLGQLVPLTGHVSFLPTLCTYVSDTYSAGPPSLPRQVSLTTISEKAEMLFEVGILP